MQGSGGVWGGGEGVFFTVGKKTRERESNIYFLKMKIVFRIGREGQTFCN